jgi:CO/xanthine dehydrogenase Mo-binding subunit
MRSDAPLLHDDLYTQGIDPKPERPSNIAKRVAFSKGDAEAGFRQADVIVSRRYTTQPVHQAYIEPHACVVSVAADAQVQIWASSQGQFMIRAYCAKLLGIDIASIWVMPAEIGGGFGGKTLIYLEPVALALSKKTGRPVKIVMTREEVFRATGPDFGWCDRSQARSQARRHDRRRRPRAQIPGGRLPGLAGAAGVHVCVCDVRSAERQYCRLRCRLEPA